MILSGVRAVTAAGGCDGKWTKIRAGTCSRGCRGRFAVGGAIETTTTTVVSWPGYACASSVLQREFFLVCNMVVGGRGRSMMDGWHEGKKSNKTTQHFFFVQLT